MHLRVDPRGENRKKTFIRRAGKGVALVLGLFAVLFLGLAAWTKLTPAPDGVLVLEYHLVDSGPVDAEGLAYTVPPEEFAAQLDVLQREGYTAITMLDYMKARKGKAVLPAKPVILTFDDGYEDNYTEMLPILEAHGMKAVVYMVTNDIGQTGYLTWDELRDMQARGIEIGSHTANHLPLTQMDPEQREKEVRDSKLLLEWNGISTVYSFSYPNGAYDDSMPEMLRRQNYLTAVTGDAGINTFATNPYELQRVNIPRPRFGLAEFRLRLWKAELMTRFGIHQHIER